MLKTLRILFVLCFAVFLVSCQPNTREKLERKWKMQGEDVSLELKSNGTYVFTEHNRPQEGKWLFKEDSKTITFIGTDDTTSRDNFLIKKLSDKKMVLEVNGDEMDFVAE